MPAAGAGRAIKNHAGRLWPAWLRGRSQEARTYLLVPLLGFVAGALVDGVVEAVPPAPAGAGLVAGGVSGALLVFWVFGMLEPTPVVCDFGACRVM